MITQREAVIISAYTGVLMTDFPAMHGYVEEILERPVMTHEMAIDSVWEEIKAAAKPDFIRVCASVEGAEINEATRQMLEDEGIEL